MKGAGREHGGRGLGTARPEKHRRDTTNLSDQPQRAGLAEQNLGREVLGRETAVADDTTSRTAEETEGVCRRSRELRQSVGVARTYEVQG